jgi:hypothetical protein
LSVLQYIPLEGLNVLALGSFKGNIWPGDRLAKVNRPFFDDNTDEKQRNTQYDF